MGMYKVVETKCTHSNSRCIWVLMDTVPIVTTNFPNSAVVLTLCIFNFIDQGI